MIVETTGLVQLHLMETITIAAQIGIPAKRYSLKTEMVLKII